MRSVDSVKPPRLIPLKMCIDYTYSQESALDLAKSDKVCRILDRDIKKDAGLQLCPYLVLRTLLGNCRHITAIGLSTFPPPCCDCTRQSDSTSLHLALVLHRKSPSHITHVASIDRATQNALNKLSGPISQSLEFNNSIIPPLTPQLIFTLRGTQGNQHLIQTNYFP